jgi:uncharacterized membrane protein
LNNHKLKQSNFHIPTAISITLIILSGIFFRICNIDKNFFWVDEVHTALWISGYQLPEIKTLLEDKTIHAEDILKFQFINSDRDLLKTIEVLKKADPQHPPLYYVSVRLWSQVFGDSIWWIRSFSVVASVISLFLIYYMCRELFREYKASLMAVLLVAVSPFHVFYAKEARQYSLLMLIIVLSNIAFLRALRINKKVTWILYGFSVAAGIYTHLVFGLLIITHGLYILILSAGKRNQESSFKIFFTYLIASMSGLLTFIPWAYIIANNLTRINKNLSWINTTVNPFHLAGMWAYNYSSIFLDTNHALNYIKKFDFIIITSYLIRAAVVALILYSIIFIVRKSSPKIWVFILCLIALPMMTFALPDLILGGSKSGLGHRYFAQSYLGIEIGVAYMLVQNMNGLYNYNKRIWQLITIAIIISGIISCSILIRAVAWWPKGIGYYNPSMAKIINQSKDPILISNLSADLISLSHLLKPNVRIRILGKSLSEKDILNSGETYFFKPSYFIIEEVMKNKNLRLEQVDPKMTLWRLRN